jgi:hypothetical protein
MAAHKALARTSVIQSWERSQTYHADFTHHCVDSLVTIPQRLDTSCTWRVPHPRGLIALLGDSNAGHFTEPVTAAANAAGYDAVVFTVSACPFNEVRQSDAFHTEQYCYDAVRKELQGVAQLRPALVVAANRDDGYIQDQTVALRPFTGGSFLHTTRQKALLWEQSLHTTLLTLNREHVPVLVVDPVPREPGVTQRVCAMISLWLQGCDSATRRATAVSELRRTTTVDRRAVLSAPDAYELNLDNELCNATVCPTVRRGLRTYFDENHLSIAGAEPLEPTFRWAFTRVLSNQGRKDLADQRAELARRGRADSKHLLVVDPVLNTGGHVRHA